MRTLETHDLRRFQSTVYPSRQPKPDVPRSRITVAQTRIESKGAALWNSIDSFPKIYRFGQPEDIGGIVSFLCSDDASYITGENIVVAGGMPSRL